MPATLASMSVGSVWRLGKPLLVHQVVRPGMIDRGQQQNVECLTDQWFSGIHHHYWHREEFGDSLT